MQTVLFTDIRAFTSISERLPATAIAELLTAYLSEACQPVLENGGRVMKFMGDGMMAVFGYDAPQRHRRRMRRRACAPRSASSRWRASSAAG